MIEKLTWGKISPEEIKWIGVDWDDCLFSNSGFPDYIPAEPLEGAVESLQYLDSVGYKIVIFTARHWADYQNIEKYCEYYKIPARRIICGKPLFKCIIDDKNIAFNGSWSKALADFLRLP